MKGDKGGGNEDSEHEDEDEADAAVGDEAAARRLGFLLLLGRVLPDAAGPTAARTLHALGCAHNNTWTVLLWCIVGCNELCRLELR